MVTLTWHASKYTLVEFMYLVWNSLPASLRNLQNLPTLSECKTQLKTFFFRRAFSQICVDQSCDNRSCICLCIYMCVCTWMVCANTLSFCFAKRFVLYALSLLMCVTDLSSVQSIHYYCWHVCDRFAARHADTSGDSTDGHSVEKRRTRLDVRVSQFLSCFSSLFCSVFRHMNIHTYIKHTHQCKVNMNRQNHVTRTKKQKQKTNPHTWGTRTAMSSNASVCLWSSCLCLCCVKYKYLVLSASL